MDRMVDPDNRYLEWYVDELYAIKLMEVASEKGVIVDKLLNAILEGFLLKLGKISPGDMGDSPVKVEVTVEPIRNDKPFFEALLTDRDANKRNKSVADRVSELELEDMDWGDV